MIDSVHSPGKSTLKRIFDLHAEETITDEQVNRVLAPVRRMIKEAGLNKPHIPLHPMRTANLTASATIFVLIVVIEQESKGNGTFAGLAEGESAPEVTASAEDMQVSRLTISVKGLRGVILTIADTDRMKTYGVKALEEDGVCVFENVPDGTYRILVSLPSSKAEGMDTGTWIVTDGKGKILKSGDSAELWEGVDIQICHAE